MIVWRISIHKTLDGHGGLYASGRWHSQGQRIVYCAPNPATALLEMLVHLEIDGEDLPTRYALLRIWVPDAVAKETVATDDLPGAWRDHAWYTRALGDAWLVGGRSAMLLVPCAIVPETWNVLLNPEHADARQITISRTYEERLDRRLIH